jgi:hypothetical protein
VKTPHERTGGAGSAINKDIEWRAPSGIVDPADVLPDMALWSWLHDADALPILTVGAAPAW